MNKMIKRGCFILLLMLTFRCLICNGQELPDSVRSFRIETKDGETDVIISGGGRSMVRNVGIDYSLWIPLGREINEFIAIPFIGITVPIRTKKQ